MRIIIYSFLLGFLLSSCKADQSGNSTASDLQAQESDLLNASATIDKIVAEIQKNPEDKSGNHERLVRAYTLASDKQMYPQALGILQSLVLEYPDDDATVGYLIKIGEIFQTLKKDETATIMGAALSEKYPTNRKVRDFAKVVGASSLSVSSDSLIGTLSRKMFDDSLFQLNELVAKQFVDACEAYAMVHQGKPQSAEFLHKAAETARTLQTIQKALSLYDWIIQKYPNSDRATQSAFLKAFTFDNNLQNYKEAEKYYKLFLAEHPTSEFAESAEFLLENLGKSDEELLQALQSKSGQ